MTQENILSYRFGFVMEQNLGHRTHYRNLLRYVRTDDTVAATWMPIEFDSPGTLAQLPIIRGNWSLRASLTAWNAVRRARKTTHLDAVFYHTQVTSLLAPLLRDVPVVISLDATPINYDSVGEHYGHASGGALEGVKFRANKRAFEHAAALVSWCQWAKDSLVRDYGVPPEKVTVIPPGVDLAQWPLRSGDDRLRSSIERKPRLLFVGGEFERKGGEILLKCFKRYLQDDCELHIVTQSPVPPSRNVYIYHNVTANSDTLLRLYSEADIFVFPTLADCAPLSVPEAMAASLPVVTTHIAAIPEMVTNGEQGLLVAPGDADALAHALVTLIERPELRAEMGDRGRARVENAYDARTNAHRLLHVLKSATDAAHRLPEPIYSEYVDAASTY